MGKNQLTSASIDGRHRITIEYDEDTVSPLDVYEIIFKGLSTLEGLDKKGLQSFDLKLEKGE